MKIIVSMLIFLNTLSASADVLTSKAKCRCDGSKIRCETQLLDAAQNAVFEAEPYTGSFANGENCNAAADQIQNKFDRTKFDWDVTLPGEFYVRMARLGTDREECRHSVISSNSLLTKISASCNLRLTFVLLDSLAENAIQKVSTRVTMTSDTGVFFNDTSDYEGNGNFPNPMVPARMAIIKIGPVIQYLEDLVFLPK